MDLTLSDEQRLLRESVDRFIAESYDADHRRRAASDPLDTARDADVLVIATPWPQYHSLVAAELARIMRGRTILDPYRVLDGKAFAAAGFVYLTLGAAPLVPGDTGLSPQA